MKQKCWIYKDSESDWWELGCQLCSRIIHISMPWTPELFQYGVEHLTSHWGRSE